MSNRSQLRGPRVATKRMMTIRVKTVSQGGLCYYPDKSIRGPSYAINHDSKAKSTNNNSRGVDKDNLSGGEMGEYLLIN